MLVMIDPIRVPCSPEIRPDHHEAVTDQPGVTSVVSLRCGVRLPVGQILQHCGELLGHSNSSVTFYQSHAVLIFGYIQIALRSPQPQSKTFPSWKSEVSVENIHHTVATKPQLIKLLSRELGQ